MMMVSATAAAEGGRQMRHCAQSQQSAGIEAVAVAAAAEMTNVEETALAESTTTLAMGRYDAAVLNPTQESVVGSTASIARETHAETRESPPSADVLACS